MAEGGHFTSLRDGSDSDYELCCTPCNEDNVREEAIKYCPECQEYLCLTCTRHHGRRKATRSHQLLDKDNAKPAGDAFDCKDVIKSRCRYHPDRDIEIYCGSHDMVYCALCGVIEHRSCSGVRKIDSVLISECDGNIDTLLAEIKDVNKQLINAAKKKEENLRCIDEQKETIHTNIQEAKRKLVEQLDVLERKCVDLLHEKHSEIKDGLESDISMIKVKMSEVEKMISSLESIPNTDAEHKFVQTKLSKKTVAEALQVLVQSESNGTKAMRFEENEALISSNMETQTFGNINVLTTCENEYMKDRILKMKSKTDISVIMETDQNICNITGICQLDDGTIVLADQRNEKLKVLDTNYKLKAELSVESSPLSICCTGKNEVAVKLLNKVLFISVGASLPKLREISTSSGAYYGVAYRAGEMWLSTGGGVNIYNTSGKLLKSINTDLRGCEIFQSTPDNMAVNGESVIVADWSDGVVCVGSDGTVKKNLRDERLTNSCGVCVTDDGVIMVAGFGSNNIVMFQENGKCLGELVSKDIGLNRPLSLCNIKKSKSVIVACESLESLYLLQLSR